MTDPDLVFLHECDNAQLKTLIDILVFDTDGKKRITEQLSATQAYAENYPNNIKAIVPQIVQEIQLFGGNSIMNVVRGHGVPYRTILEDVCDRLKVNYSKSLPTPILESELLRKVAVTVIDKMTEDDIKKIDTKLDKTRLLNALTRDNGAAMMAVIAIVVAQFSKQAAKTGALMLFGRVLSQRALAFAVPILNVAAAAWTIADIASPAYRVTIPFTLTTSFIRRQTEAIDDLNGLFA